MFLQELGPIEAEAFLTLACEMIEDDGIICLEENDLLDQYQKELGITGFSFDPTAAAAARRSRAEPACFPWLDRRGFRGAQGNLPATRLPL